MLFVEDDGRVVHAVREGLSQAGMTLHHAGTIAEAHHHLASRRHFDVIILDLNLPDGDGRTIVRECEAQERRAPILMVTANDTVEDRIAGLRCGADDYICKPFAVSELHARIQAVLRRANPKDKHMLRYDDVELDLLHRKLRRGPTDVELSTREVDFLAYLLNHPEQVLTKEQLLRDVWDEVHEQDHNVLHVYANYLRNKLERDAQPRILHTVRGVGYILSRLEPGELFESTR